MKTLFKAILQGAGLCLGYMAVMFALMKPYMRYMSKITNIDA